MLNSNLKLKERILSKIKRGETVELLKKLIKTPSYSGREGELKNLILSELEDLNTEVWTQEVYPGASNVFCLFKGEESRGDSLLVNGHMDTVQVFDMQNPFKPREHHGRVFGRGAADMKGGLTAMIQSIKALSELDGLKKSVIFSFVVDEEEAARGTLKLLFELDRKGLNVESAVVCEPTNLRICNVHCGTFEFKVKVKGLSGHGSDPSAGKNAIEYAIKLIEKLKGFSFFKRNEMFSLNIGRIEGGLNSWVIPFECEFEALTHFPPETKPRRIRYMIEDKIRDLGEESGVKFELKVISSDEGYKVDEKEEIVVILKNNIEHVMGKCRFGFLRSWTDAITLHHFGGIKTVLFGPGELKVCHSPNENVKSEDVVKAAKMIAGSTYDYSLSLYRLKD